MRKRFTLRVAFLPTRLSAEHLREAYEAVTPVIDRAVKSTVDTESAVDADDRVARPAKEAR